MRSKYKVPRDLPAAACGRCMWWKQTDDEGWEIALSGKRNGSTNAWCV